MNKNIVLCGVGGQGTVLASKLFAAAAMANDINVLSAETIGMAQRGGSVFSFLRMGDDIHSPMIKEHEADVIIGFEPAETVRMLSFLKDDGTVIVNKKAIKPVTAALSGSSYTGEEMLDYLKDNVKNLYIIDGEKACEDIGSAKVLNIVLLGATVEHCDLPVNKDDIKNAIKLRVNEKFHEINFKAIDYVK